jgi:hypothetical protein
MWVVGETHRKSLCLLLSFAVNLKLHQKIKSITQVILENGWDIPGSGILPGKMSFSFSSTLGRNQTTRKEGPGQPEAGEESDSLVL